MIRATSSEGYIGCARALQGLDYLKDLGQLKARVLYLVGGEDAAAPPDAMAAMADATPQSEFVVLPGLAHLVNLDDPVAFADAVGPWLESAAAEHGR